MNLRHSTLPQPQDSHDFFFKECQCPAISPRRPQIIQTPSQQIKHFRLGMIQLQNQLQQLSKICRHRRVPVAFAQRLAVIIHHHLPQAVKLTSGTPAPLKLSLHKKVHPPRKGTLRTPGPLCHRLNQTGSLCHPMHDQTGLRQFRQPNNNTATTFHAPKTNALRQGDETNLLQIPLTFSLPSPTPHRLMENESIADLLAIDTSSFEARLSELRRYL